MSKFRLDAQYIAWRELVNIHRWHQVGYCGRHLAVFCDDVGGNHVELVADILETILPGAKIYTGHLNYHQRNGNVVCKVYCDTTNETMDFDQFIVKYKIKLINNSTTGRSGAMVNPIGAWMREKIRMYHLIMTASAGNGYGQPINTFYYGAAILVTSVRQSADGRILSGQCAEGEGIDFSMFHGIMPGTSFSAPFLLGMIGLLAGEYPQLTQEEAYGYLKSHCLSLGKREVFGWGLPILGEPGRETL